MEKVAQQFGITQVNTTDELNGAQACTQLDQPQTLSLQLLELVGGGTGEEASAPVKGW